MDFKSLLVVLCIVKTSTQVSTNSNDHYIAAVVEFNKELSNNTWEEFSDLIAEAAQSKVDVILFPVVASRTTALKVPLLKNYSVPALCPEVYDEPLVTISEAARKYSMYVVVNVHEVLDCTDEDVEEKCPEQKKYSFITNVVFDRTGALILRYRKNHLLEDINIDPSFNHEVASFDTDFGVKFGVVIGFDILNQMPAMKAIGQGIKNILVNMNWMSELPFITAVQTQESLAFGLDINLIASGLNEVSNYASGSGIYSGKGGTLVSFITGVPTTKLLIAKVPKIPGDGHKGTGPVRQNPAYFDGLATITDKSLKSHVSKLLSPGLQEIKLSFNDIRCKFIIRMKDRNGEKSYKYRAGAFSGTRTIENQATIGTRDCAIFTCTEETIDSCGKRFIPFIDNSTAVFEELIIEATVPIEDSETIDSTFYPSTLDIAFLPLEPNNFDYTVKEVNNVTVHKLSLKDIDTELYTFGLWGRDFLKDNGKITQVYEQIEGASVEEMIKKNRKEFENIEGKSYRLHLH